MSQHPFTPAAFRPGDAQKVLGISTPKLYQLINAGLIRAHKVGGCTLIRTDEALDAICPKGE